MNRTDLPDSFRPTIAPFITVRFNSAGNSSHRYVLSSSLYVIRYGLCFLNLGQYILIRYIQLIFSIRHQHYVSKTSKDLFPVSFNNPCLIKTDSPYTNVFKKGTRFYVLIVVQFRCRIQTEKRIVYVAYEIQKSFRPISNDVRFFFLTTTSDT